MSPGRRTVYWCIDCFMVAILYNACIHHSHKILQFENEARQHLEKNAFQGHAAKQFRKSPTLILKKYELPQKLKSMLDSNCAILSFDSVLIQDLLFSLGPLCQILFGLWTISLWRSGWSFWGFIWVWKPASSVNIGFLPHGSSIACIKCWGMFNFLHFSTMIRQSDLASWIVHCSRTVSKHRGHLCS